MFLHLKSTLSTHLKTYYQAILVKQKEEEKKKNNFKMHMYPFKCTAEEALQGYTNTTPGVTTSFSGAFMCADPSGITATPNCLASVSSLKL